MNIQSMLYGRPTKGTATGRVWEIADAITREYGIKAKRSQVIEAYVLEGGNPNTASTQYHHWAQYQANQEADANLEINDLETAVIQLKIESNGRLLIPLELRKMMKVGESGRVAAKIVNGELRLVSPAIALQKLQSQAAELALGDISVVDEFIAEKREEAARE